MSYRQRSRSSSDKVQVARKTVENLPTETEDPSRLLAHFGTLDQICNALLAVGAQSMEQYRTMIDVSLIYSLGSCSRALRRNGAREPTFEENAIPALLDLVAEIIEETAASTLPLDVQLFIVRRLRDVEAALRAFQVAGYSGVESALDALIGAVWRTAPASHGRTATRRYGPCSAHRFPRVVGARATR